MCIGGIRVECMIYVLKYKRVIPRKFYLEGVVVRKSRGIFFSNLWGSGKKVERAQVSKSQES